MDFNKEWLDKYQKNLDDLNQLVKEEDKIDICKVSLIKDRIHLNVYS
jgi:hypothetical protein